MSDERPATDDGQRQIERDSQVSAMFDGELSAAECELLARRLAKDQALRAQWSRYSLVGAALRAERGVALHDRLARKVQAAVSQESTYGESEVAATRNAAAVPVAAGSAATRWMRYSRPLAGAGIAASVAVMSILWLRSQEAPESDGAALLASNVPAVSSAAPETAIQITDARSGATVASTGEPERYTTPAPSSRVSNAPSARLANYVVAHSEYSGPLSRRMALLSLVGGENAEVQNSSELAEDMDAAPAVRPAEPNDAP
jgi:negative regulator of sigma E activity